MALNVKKATRKALEEWKRHRAAAPVSERRAAVLSFLKERVWTGVPRNEKGRVLSRAGVSTQSPSQEPRP